MSSPPDRRAARRARRPLRGLLTVLLVLPLVGACAGGGDTVRTASSPSPVAEPATELVVAVTPAPGGAPVRATLTCEPAGGDHPDPEQACADLTAQPEPLAPRGADMACTEQYGGPQTAQVTGTYRGEPVRLELSRVDGCAISQWDRLGAVLDPLVTGGP